MDSKNTSFGVETAFSDVRLGDSIVFYDEVTKQTIKAVVLTKETFRGKPVLTAETSWKQIFCVWETQKVWVVKELRIKAVDIDCPSNETFHINLSQYSKDTTYPDRTPYHSNVFNGLFFSSASNVFSFLNRYHPMEKGIEINLLIENDRPGRDRTYN